MLEAEINPRFPNSVCSQSSGLLLILWPDQSPNLFIFKLIKFIFIYFYFLF
jgi:hypothetical protein